MRMSISLLILFLKSSSKAINPASVRGSLGELATSQCSAVTWNISVTVKRLVEYYSTACAIFDSPLLAAEIVSCLELNAQSAKNTQRLATNDAVRRVRYAPPGDHRP